jgi:nucleoside-diphosphate-sugar epimerase
VRIFVSGITGFIGSHFVEHAAAAGHDVVGLQRRSVTRLPIRAEVRSGDLLHRTSLDHALEGIDCVCHFAAAFKEAHADEEYFRRVNVSGTVNLLDAAHAAGVKRFVLCSTAGIYGRQVPGVINENHPPQPWNAYERSKVAAEAELRRGAARYGMEYVILRPSAVYGPRDPRLAKLFRNAARGRFPLFGKGDGRRHMVYVADLTEAFLLACTRPQAANNEMIVAGPEAVRLRELLQTLAQIANRRSAGPRLPLKPMLALAAVTEDVCRWLRINPPLHRRRMDFYMNDAEFDCAHARRVLGWEPRVPLRDGLAATLRAERHATADPALAHGSVWLAEMAALGEALDSAGARFFLG